MCSKLESLSGVKIGSVTLGERTDEIGCDGKRMVEAFCSCGERFSVPFRTAKSGNVRCRKCGGGNLSAHLKLPAADRSLSHRWHNMLGRCTNPKNNNFIDYGGRGITVCDEWRNFVNYKNWMFSNGYTYENPENLSVERIDNDGPYSPENCTLIPKSLQSRNRRCTTWVVRQDTGEQVTTTEYADLCGKSPGYISMLIKNGKPLPPITEGRTSYRITAYTDGEAYRSFQHKKSVRTWCSSEVSKIWACLAGKLDSALGFGWYYTNDSGEKFKEVDGKLKKID